MSDRRIRLYPTGDHVIGGVPAVEYLLPPDHPTTVALLAYRPAAFTTSKPDGYEPATEGDADGKPVVVTIEDPDAIALPRGSSVTETSSGGGVDFTTEPATEEPVP